MKYPKMTKGARKFVCTAVGELPCPPRGRSRVSGKGVQMYNFRRDPFTDFTSFFINICMKLTP